MAKRVELPVEPKDKAFEEYVTAYLQAVGYFTERNIVERETAEVLELDTTLTDYEQVPPKNCLVEIKSGGWGFPDIFKVKGWLSYLNMDSALFVCSTGKGQKAVDDFYIGKSKEIGMDLVILEDLNRAPLSLGTYLKGRPVETVDISMWRYAYWIERKLIAKLTASRKSSPGARRYGEMMGYYQKVNNAVFFIDNVLERLEKLYSAYMACPNLSAKVGNDISRGVFDGDQIPWDVFKENYNQCRPTDINISSYIEHRARLSILRNVVDFIIFRRYDKDHPKIDRRTKFLGFSFDRFDLLPRDLRSRIETLSQDEYVHLYPSFWQWFMWVFGGLIFDDYRDREYELLSRKTGLPQHQIDKALAAYGLLFPTEEGWFSKPSSANITHLKLFPVPFMGTGANFRRFNYSPDGTFAGLKLSGLHTRDDIGRWNDCAVELLGGGPG